MTLKQLGSIYSSNGDFTTRAAILQSWYRVSINEKCGLGSKNIVKGKDQHGKTILESVKQEYGHLVEGGETRNINFFFQETYEYAKYRVEHKKPDETIKADSEIASLKPDCPEESKNWLNWFYDRYLNFNKTDHLFKEFSNQ